MTRQIQQVFQQPEDLWAIYHWCAGVNITLSNCNINCNGLIRVSLYAGYTGLKFGKIPSIQKMRYIGMQITQSVNQ